MRALLVAVPLLAIAAGVAIVVATRPGTTPSERSAAITNGAADAASPTPAGGTTNDKAEATPAAPMRDAPAARSEGRATPAGTAAAPRRVTWPVAPRRSASGNSSRSSNGGAQSGDGIVPVRLAFWSLWYLGVDPAAETTWSRAINDPRQPAGVRSDLIVDMIDEGYTDNDRPGLADLALIRRRLEILERHAPHAIDDVNAKAFEEAYQTMLELYLRLGGEARIPAQPR